MLKVKRAVLSVSDKEGVVDFAKGLSGFGVEILSTGGTLALLRKHGIRALPISDYTGFPEILEGRVKTLHPKIHGGILHRREKKSHVREAAKHGIPPIDMVVVNLYPFEQVTKAKKVSLERALEEIDIGGPTMLRAAAKNFRSVAVVSEPADYATVLDEMRRHRGGISEETLYGLACKVFQLSSHYDAVIEGFLRSLNGGEALPQSFRLNFRKRMPLRYGENPHQRAALYAREDGDSLEFRCLHGKELSYNNLVDLESAWNVVQEFEEPAACVIKHNNPCGIACSGTLAEAVAGAVDCDPLSSFGGIVGLNRPCDAKTAEAILVKLTFLEVIVTPAFAPKALEFLQARKNLRLVEMRERRHEALNLRSMKAGLLVQDAERSLRGGWEKFKKTVRCVTRKRPTEEDLRELFFAWRAAKHVRSNAIVLARERKTVGIGAGQMSRVDSVEIACRKAGPKAQGSCLASDGFFPMPDSIELAARHGIRAVVQPGGSIKDQEVTEAADRFRLIMVCTGTRHFRH